MIDNVESRRRVIHAMHTARFNCKSWLERVIRNDR